MATKVKLIADGVITPDQITLTTASTGTNTTAPATTAFVQQEISALVDSSPDALNTLNELAAALGDDANFSTTVTNSIATKLPLAGGSLTGALDITAAGNQLTLSRSGFDNILLGTGTVNGQVGFHITNSTDSIVPVSLHENAPAATLVVDSTGNVGIGTTSPSDELHIAKTASPRIRIDATGSTQNAELLLINSADGLYSSVVGDGNNLLLATQGSERLRIDSSGNVGIGGTPVAGAKLQSQGALFVNGVISAAPSSPTLAIDYASGGARFISYDHSTNDPRIYFITSSSTSTDERMRIDSSGNVGIGTTADIATSSSSSSTGFWFSSSDYLAVARNQQRAAIFNRIGNDGEIVAIRRDGSTIGSIGSEGGDSLFIQGGTTSGAGLLCHGSAAKVLPVRNSASIDATIDLGQDSRRFKDLHLSGGVYSLSEVQTTSVGLGSAVAGQSVGTTYSEPRGVFWHNGGGMTDYSIHRTAGVWSGDYQQLKLDWDTGIFIDGGTEYGKSGVHISEKVSLGDSSYSNFGSPNYEVHIVGDGSSLAIESGTGEAYLGSQNTSYFHFLGNRNFYFGNRCEASGGFHTYSDERLKENITPITNALDKVSQMNGITFSWIDAENRGGGDTGKQFGVTAQNMLEVDNELPTLNKDPLASQDEIDNEESTDYYSMDYNRITPFLIEAIKELKTELDAAKARITELEG